MSPDPANTPNTSPDPTPPSLSGAKLPPSRSPITVDDSNFATEVLKSTEPVLVDFWAPGCGPCRRLAPVIDQIARDFAAEMKVAKVDVADAYQTALDQSITAVPTLKLFIGGAVAMEIRGVISKDALTQELRKALP